MADDSGSAAYERSALKLVRGLQLDPAVSAFYRDNQSVRIWTTDQGLVPEATQLAELLKRAPSFSHGVDRTRVSDLEKAVEDARSGKHKDLARAELLLSNALVAYANELHRAGAQQDFTYIDAELRPAPPTPAALLAAAARSPSAALASLQALNPVYASLSTGLAWYRTRWGSLPQTAIARGPDLRIGSRGERVRQLRRRLGASAVSAAPDVFDAGLAASVREFRRVHGLGDAAVADAATIAALNLGASHFEEIIRANLDRARSLPARPGNKHIVVDAAGATLWMMEGDQRRDTMRVIVGKPSMQTPQLGALVRFAVLNPYWNIPPDLVRLNVAPKVLQLGPAHLKQKRYEVLSDWSPAARTLRPEKVNWTAAASGAVELRVRQLPGADNMMGAVKFMFPNDFGVYLHDTPQKTLFAQADRHLSSGCVRLEDADRLGRWMFGKPLLSKQVKGAEREVPLPEPVPVYITYLTAVPEGGQVRFQSDPYGLDRKYSSRPGGVEPKIVRNEASPAASYAKVPKDGGAALAAIQP